MIAPSVTSLDGTWLLATDPDNLGREQEWWRGPAAGAVPAKVPWIIQDAFPGYHGVAWYWREFVVPVNDLPGGRTLLRFWAVDYLAEVWLNGQLLGGHEGGETPFVLDITDAVRPGEANHLAVRVLNPTHDPIDGIVLNETPHRNKALPYWAGSAWNQGGIMDSVELLLVPAVRVEDLFVRADPHTGIVRVQTTVCNAGEATTGELELTLAPATSGETLLSTSLACDLPPGDTLLETELRFESPHLWELNDPYLYRVTARLRAVPPPFEGGGQGGRKSVRFGFRSFTFSDGAFRLNGRRLFLRCSHTGNCCPVGLEMPVDPDWLRRDLINVKAMGFNAIRWIAGIPKRYQLDMCDEIGLIVYEECYAGWCMADSPKFVERYDRSTREMILRDRNHPSVVIWGLLNETADGPVFRHAVDSLPLVHDLDDSRLVMLNSGRFDGQMYIGSLCNPGSTEWEYALGGEAPDAPATGQLYSAFWERAGDGHLYPRVPHSAEAIAFIRRIGEGTKPVVLTEYGIGSAVDLVRVARHYEQLGATHAEDATYYRALLERFLVDWQRWNLADTFCRPEDYFAACLTKMADQRLLGLNAIRANPNLAGYSLTGTVDQGMTGEGLTTTFREFKPGTMDAMADGFAPLRLCLFAEPVHVYAEGTVHFEAVLANEDALLPGEYHILLQVFDPDGRQVCRHPATVTIPERNLYEETPLALPVGSFGLGKFAEPGKYRFVACFERGGAAAGGEAIFYVADRADMPAVAAEVTLWGEDEGLAEWLAAHCLSDRQAPSPSRNGRGGRGADGVGPSEVILVGSKPPSPGGETAFAELLARVKAGATAVLLCPEVFAEGDNPSAHLPVPGSVTPINGWLYLKDEWTKRHPIFAGLPCGGLMDYTYYREIIPDLLFMGTEPDEVVAGAMKTSQDYSAGLMVAVHKLGEGRIILNTLLIRENLGRHPAAERLLRNMLNYAAE